MFDHHLKTIENIRQQFEPNLDNLALIINGSVAREEAGEGSDLDFLLVINDSRFDELTLQGALTCEAHEYCVPPCAEANGYLMSKAKMRQIRDQGNEIDRWTFYKAKVVFSRDDEIVPLLEEIPRYPEEGRQYRMESFYSQIFYHFSFFEFAYLSQTKYLIYETATKMILSIGRLILADNRILYPNRKWFFRELCKAPDKPPGICEAMLEWLDHPTIEGGNQIIQMLQTYKAYSLPPEGMKARINKELLLNLEEW